MVRAFLRTACASALGFLLAFLLWRGLSVECPAWEDESDATDHGSLV